MIFRNKPGRFAVASYLLDENRNGRPSLQSLGFGPCQGQHLPEHTNVHQMKSPRTEMQSNQPLQRTAPRFALRSR